MPLLFVHGVNVRSAPDPAAYEASVRARDALFRTAGLRTLASNPKAVKILNPYWGDLGSKFPWNHAALPTGSEESFGFTEDAAALLQSVAAAYDGPAPRTALESARCGSLSDAVDLLWAASAVHATTKELAESWAVAGAMAVHYAQHDPRPDWLDDVENDKQLIDRLRNELEEWHPLGDVPTPSPSDQEEVLGSALFTPFATGFGLVRKWLPELTNAAARKVGRLIVDSKREELHRNLARFFGDVFVYLDSRGTVDQPGEIVTRILKDLDEAHEMRSQPGAEDTKLYVIGHSMGGVIAYDILTHFRPLMPVDAFVTVGSQVAVFEEMKLFIERDQNAPIKPAIDRTARPSNIGCWINVFDDQDILGFATEGIFSGTRDFAFSTGKPLLVAHSSYLSQPSFHERLADRLGSVCQ